MSEARRIPWVGASTLMVILILASSIYYYQFIYIPVIEAGKPKFVAETRTFNVTAFQFGFNPNPIEVNRGDTVILRFRATFEKEPAFREHGFFLEVYDLSVTLPKDQVVEVKFVAEKSGTFRFFCTIYCGVGHGGMAAQLIVR